MDQNQSFVDQLETVTQELHSAKQQIGILNASVAHLTAENADIQHELSTLLDKEKDDKIRLKSVSDVCQITETKVTELNERLQLAVEEKESALKKVEELSALLEENKKPDEGKQSSVCLCESETAVLQEKLEQMELDKDLKKNQLADAVADLHKALEKNVNMKSEMEELNMELECLQSQISSQYNVIQCQREELDGMRSQADTLACPDINRKGNSLFSEVEDRRVMVETKMAKTLDKTHKLETRLKREHKENQRLKNQVTLLMRSANKVSDKTVRALENEVEDSKRQVLKLTEQLVKQSEQVKKASEEPRLSLSPTDDETSLVSYFKATISQLQKEREKVKKEKDDLQIQCVQLDFFWTQKKNEARSLMSEKDRLTALNAHLSMTVESLRSESVSTDDDQQPREMVKISEMDFLNDESKSDSDKDKRDADLMELVDSRVSESEKENTDNRDLRSFLLGSKSKSVTFTTDDTDVGILSDVGNQLGDDGTLGQEEGDGSGKGKGSKVKKSGSNGKYRSVTYVNLEDMTVEEDAAPKCKQQ